MSQTSVRPENESGDESAEVLPSTLHFVKEKSQSKGKKCSVEDTLESVTDMLQVMKDFMLSSGMRDDKIKGKPRTFGQGKQGKEMTNTSVSETTIYQNILSKIDDGEGSTVQVDPEIAFKKRTELVLHQRNQWTLVMTSWRTILRTK